MKALIVRVSSSFEWALLNTGEERHLSLDVRGDFVLTSSATNLNDEDNQIILKRLRALTRDSGYECISKGEIIHLKAVSDVNQYQLKIK